MAKTEKVKCQKCGVEVDAFVCGEGQNINDIEDKIVDGLPVVRVIQYFRNRDAFNSWECYKCNPPMEFD